MNRIPKLIEWIRQLPEWGKILGLSATTILALVGVYRVYQENFPAFILIVVPFVVLIICLAGFYLMFAKKPPAFIGGRSLPSFNIVTRIVAGLVVFTTVVSGGRYYSSDQGRADLIGALHGTFTPTPVDTPLPSMTPTLTFTSTPSPLPTTISNATYFMIVLDASAGMTQEFDNTTKWEAALESVNGIIDGLDPLANYGLIVIGGEPVAGGVNPCNEPSSLRAPFTNREKVKEQIGQLQPAGGGSLYTAFNLANNQFRNLPPGGIGTLIYVTGSTDICDQDEWDQLEKLFEIPGPGGVVALLYSEIIIIENDQDVRRTIQEQMASVSQNLVVQAPPSFTYIQDITNNIVINHVENHIDIIVANIPPTKTPTPTPTQAPSSILGVTDAATEVNALPNPTNTFTPIPPTHTPTFTFTPSLTFTPTPVVSLLYAEYVGSGEGCSANIYFQVTGSSAFGYFRVTNNFYRNQTPPYDPGYPFMELPVGPNGFQVGLGGNGDPINYYHEVWFEYNGSESNHLTNLICPGLTPP